MGYIKGNSAVYDWQAGRMTEEDPGGCVIDRTAAWELFGNEAAGGQILVQDHVYTVRKVADWVQKILLLGAAQKGEKELSYSRIFIRKRNNKTVQNMVSGFLTKYNLQGKKKIYNKRSRVLDLEYPVFCNGGFCNLVICHVCFLAGRLDSAAVVGFYILAEKAYFIFFRLQAIFGVSEIGSSDQAAAPWRENDLLWSAFMFHIFADESIWR